MRFRYRARTQKGELQVGFIEAPNRDQAGVILSGHELYVLLLEEMRRDYLTERLLGYIRRVKVKDLMIFTRQFATLLSAKIPLGDTLLTLERQTRNPTLQEVIREISSDVDAGLALSQAMEKHQHVFSSFYVNLVRSAEITGRVDEVVNFLADYIEKEAVLMSRVKNALMYPVIMVILFLVVVIIMATVVLPKVGPVFAEAGVAVPLFTKILIAGGEFLVHWWWLTLLFLAVLIFFIYDYFRSSEGRVLRDEIVFRLPFFNNLLKELYVARFAQSLSVLIKGGIPIAQAIEITGHVIDSPAYREVLHQAGIDVSRGELLSQSLARKENLFPPLVSQMLAVGESTGRMDELLERIGGFYTREVDNLLNNLVELIQPILIVVIGIFVGILFASILVPIYDLVQSFRV